MGYKLLEILVKWIYGAIMATLDTAMIYLIVDKILGYEINWTLVIVAWMILQVHHSDEFDLDN